MKAAYSDPAMAVAAGFAPTDECVASPAGAMGMHYVNFARMGDAAVDPFEPKVLLYLPTADGLKLVAVEWLVGVGAPGTPVPDDAPDAPVLLRQTMGGPMAGHDADMPPHFDLHMWLENKPDGRFAGFNPALSCPPE